MALDSRFKIASDLQSYFVDRTTGLPLSNGYIKFFQDEAHTIAKNVYILSGSYPGYTYTNIGSTVSLSAVGTVSYNNNDVILYYFPYDGDATTSTGIVQNYFVQVYDQNNVLQFSRQAWPNIVSQGTGADNTLLNYIPNGQFLSHNNLPATATYLAGQIREDVTNISPGGWTFERNTGSTATNLVTFSQFLSPSANPTGGPKYAVLVNTTAVGTASRKDLCIKFNDANKFATADTYTLFTTCKKIGSSTDLADVYVYKYCGVGGSAFTEVPIGQLQFTNTYVGQTIKFSFGVNDGLTINDGSYVQIRIRFPVDDTGSWYLTDFVLTPGSVDVSAFPYQTEADSMTRSVFGWTPVPDYNGADLYLPFINTKTGGQYDTSCIGDACLETQVSQYVDGFHTSTNRLLANGQRILKSSYSPLGIPMSRLFNAYFDATLNGPIYGTGANYVFMTTQGTNVLRLVQNTYGAVTAPTVGTSGFTAPVTVSLGVANTNFQCFMVSATAFQVVCTTAGAVSAPATVGTGLTGSTYTELQDGGTYSGITIKEVQQISLPSAASIAGGDYFTIYNTTTKFAIWFTKDGSGSAPSVGATNIQVNITTGDTQAIVNQKCREVMNGWGDFVITCNAAASITNSSYWLFSTTDGTYTNFYVWYNINGTGVDPAIANKYGIQVAIGSTDTSTQVATKTQAAINSYFYAVPDAHGLFPRFLANGSTNDPDAASRWSMVPGVIGDTMGTFQLYGATGISSHQHAENMSIDNGGGVSTLYSYGYGSTSSGSFKTINANGIAVSNANTRVLTDAAVSNPGLLAAEDRTYNMAFNLSIKY